MLSIYHLRTHFRLVCNFLKLDLLIQVIASKVIFEKKLQSIALGKCPIRFFSEK